MIIIVSARSLESGGHEDDDLNDMVHNRVDVPVPEVSDARGGLWSDLFEQASAEAGHHISATAATGEKAEVVSPSSFGK